MMQIRSCTTWSNNGVRKRETHHSLYSHARTRTRVYTRSFMFFTVTSVTHTLNLYITTHCKNKHQIWTRKRFTSPLFLIVWQQYKRILQSNLPCSSAFFSSLSEWCDRCDSKNNNFPREYARACEEDAHQARIKTDVFWQVKLALQRYAKIFRHFSAIFSHFEAISPHILIEGTAWCYKAELSNWKGNKLLTFSSS